MQTEIKVNEPMRTQSRFLQKRGNALKTNEGMLQTGSQVLCSSPDPESKKET